MGLRGVKRARRVAGRVTEFEVNAQRQLRRENRVRASSVTVRSLVDRVIEASRLFELRIILAFLATFFRSLWI